MTKALAFFALCVICPLSIAAIFNYAKTWRSKSLLFAIYAASLLSLLSIAQ
jgi:hypothetical protein